MILVLAVLLALSFVLVARQRAARIRVRVERDDPRLARRPHR